MIIELLDVQPYDSHQMMCTLDVTDDGGTTVRTAYFLPYDAAEWRIAEYDLDPADHETVLDILLWEMHAHADVPEDLKLHHAPTVEAARTAMLGAVRARKATSDSKRAAKLRGKGAGEDPEPAAREKMRGLCLVQDDVVEVKREHVHRQRETISEQRSASLAPPLPLAGDRAAQFKSASNLTKEPKGHGN
jgi:hypothetical protein